MTEFDLCECCGRKMTDCECGKYDITIWTFAAVDHELLADDRSAAETMFPRVFWPTRDAAQAAAEQEIRDSADEPEMAIEWGEGAEDSPLYWRDDLSGLYYEIYSMTLAK
jgi:hypothetical protein